MKMTQRTEMKQQSQKTLKRLIPSLVVNWLFPLVLYSLLRSNLATDTAALTISGAVPAMWTLVHWIKRNRVDWISLLGLFGFAVALVVTVLSGRDSLPLKLYHPAVAGTIGAIFLFSVVIRKPLLITLFRSFKIGDLQRFTQPLVRKKITIVTAVIGVVLLIDTLIQVFMALTLSTGTYLIVSRAITLAMLAILFVIVKWFMRRKK